MRGLWGSQAGLGGSGGFWGVGQAGFGGRSGCFWWGVEAGLGGGEIRLLLGGSRLVLGGDQAGFGGGGVQAGFREDQAGFGGVSSPVWRCSPQSWGGGEVCLTRGSPPRRTSPPSARRPSPPPRKQPRSRIGSERPAPRRTSRTSTRSPSGDTNPPQISSNTPPPLNTPPRPPRTSPNLLRGCHDMPGAADPGGIILLRPIRRLQAPLGLLQPPPAELVL